MSRYKWSFKEERLEQILQVIQTNASIMVSDLAKQFHISESTVRLDLAKLEEDNLITRTHGGAIIKKDINGNNLLNPDSIMERKTVFQKEKDAIGRMAASLIDDGDTLLIDGGSTTANVIKYLVNKHNLTIITNSLIMIQELLANPNINLFVLGGLAFSKHGVTVGSLTNVSLSYFYPNKTIIGIDGLSVDRGLMAADPSVPAVAAVKSEMVKISDQLIVICDHTKINKVCPLSVAPIDVVDILVTDSGASDEDVKAISQKGPKVLIAD